MRRSDCVRQKAQTGLRLPEAAKACAGGIPTTGMKKGRAPESRSCTSKSKERMRRGDCVRQKSANGFAPAGDSKGMRRKRMGSSSMELPIITVYSPQNMTNQDGYV